MNSITHFQFNCQEIRFVDDPNQLYAFGIVAQDLAKILDLTNSHQLAVDEEWKGSDIITTPGGNQNVSIIWEPGVYQAIAKSRKPNAKLFQKWVFAEVLPSIRKTGSYSISEVKPKTALELAKEQVKLLEQLEIQQLIIEEQEKDLLRQAEIIDELFDYSSIIRIAKFNQVSEKNFNWRLLKAVSIKLELPIKKAPDPRFKDKNLYHHNVWRFAYPNVLLPETTTLVIQK